MRKGLVITQFAISLVLIAGTFVVIRQVDFMREKDKGFDINNVVAFITPRTQDGEEHGPKLEAFKKRLLQESVINKVGATSNIPGGGSSDINSNTGEIQVVGKTQRISTTTYIQYTDDNFFNTLDVEFLHGRSFDEDIATDTSAAIVNEAFLNQFDIAELEDVLLESIQFGTDEGSRHYKIVGIIKNFNRTSLKTQVEPTIYFLIPDVRRVVVKFQEGSFTAGLKTVENIWDQFYPNSPLNVTFVDQRFELLHAEDKRFGNVFGAFSFLAITVSILGLFGLSSFMASQRTKEMGIRKVLGASIPNIVTIFYKDFAILIGISALIGLPLFYFLMDQWLDNYAYRIVFPWDVMPMTLVLVLSFAFLTVGFQIFRVAIINPAKIIRYE